MTLSQCQGANLRNRKQCGRIRTLPTNIIAECTVIRKTTWIFDKTQKANAKMGKLQQILKLKNSEKTKKAI